MKYAEDRDVQLRRQLDIFVSDLFEPTLFFVDQKKKELISETLTYKDSETYQENVGDIKLLGQLVVCINNLKIMHAEIVSGCRNPAVGL